MTAQPKRTPKASRPSRYVLDPSFAYNDSILDNILAHAREVDVPTVVEFKRQTKPRTDPQNAALWMAYGILMADVGLAGERDRLELHRNFCGDFFTWVDLPCGGRRPLRTTTTDENGQRDVLPWDRFCEFYEHVRQVAAEACSCVIPDPDPTMSKRYPHQRAA
jgi:hypothetical protein